MPVWCPWRGSWAPPGPPSPAMPLLLKAERGCGCPHSATPSILPTLSAGLWELPFQELRVEDQGAGLVVLENEACTALPPFSDSAPTRPFPSSGRHEHAHVWPLFKPGHPWMPRFGPHPRLTNSYHCSRPSSRPTSLLGAEWVSPVSVLSQPLGQCDGAPKTACDQIACVHQPLSRDCKPGGQAAFPCFACLLATSLGLSRTPFLPPHSSLSAILPSHLAFPLAPSPLPHCWPLHQSGRPALCWIHEDPSGSGGLEAAGVGPPAPRCVPGCWPCCLLSSLRESHCQARG